MDTINKMTDINVGRRAIRIIMKQICSFSDDLQYKELENELYYIETHSPTEIFLLARYLPLKRKPIIDMSPTLFNFGETGLYDSPSFMPVYFIHDNFMDLHEKHKDFFEHLLLTLEYDQNSSHYRKKSNQKYREISEKYDNFEKMNIEQGVNKIIMEEIGEYLTAQFLKNEGYIVGNIHFNYNQIGEKTLIPDLYAFKSDIIKKLNEANLISGGAIFSELFTLRERGKVKGKSYINVSDETMVIEVEPSRKRAVGQSGRGQLEDKPGYFTNMKGFDKGLLVTPGLSKKFEFKNNGIGMLGMNNDGLEYFPPDKTRDNLDIDLKRKYIKDFETTVKMALISNLYFDEIMELVNMSNNHFSFKSMIAVLKDIPVDMVIKKILDSID